MADEVSVSEQLANRVYDVAHDVLSENGGGIIDGFVLGTSYTNAEGERCWSFSVAPGQRLFTTAGIVELVVRCKDAEFSRAVD